MEASRTLAVGSKAGPLKLCPHIVDGRRSTRRPRGESMLLRQCGRFSRHRSTAIDYDCGGYGHSFRQIQLILDVTLNLRFVLDMPKRKEASGSVEPMSTCLP
ncbi:hypothetical protein M8J77_013423 [Diaphorina citri]|nr:hypothetical protein M8J77_013423 [Diaphorina citri]